MHCFSAKGSRSQSGQAIVLTACCLVVACGFLGLAVDVGAIRATQRHLQSTADAAALAGAIEIDYCEGISDCSRITTAAQDALAENGMTGSALVTQCGTPPVSTLIVVVNNGPCALGSSSADPNYGNANYVETELAETVPTYFLRLFGMESVHLTARSEATVGNMPFCIFVSPDGATQGTLDVESGGQVTASCGIADDGSFTDKGNGSHVSSTVFDVSGSMTGAGNQLTPSPQSNSTVLPDPLKYLQTADYEPMESSCTSANTNILVTSSETLLPGTYCGSGGHAAIEVASGTLTLSDNNNSSGGMYVLEGNIQVDTGAGNPAMTGSDVTLYFESGSFTGFSGNNVDLVAPTTGLYAGILIDAPQSNTATLTMDSGSQSTWQGAVYLPGGSIDENAGGNLAAYTIIVANSVMIDHGSKFTIGADYSSLANGSPAKGETGVLAE